MTLNDSRSLVRCKRMKLRATMKHVRNAISRRRPGERASPLPKKSKKKPACAMKELMSCSETARRYPFASALWITTLPTVIAAVYLPARLSKKVNAGQLSGLNRQEDLTNCPSSSQGAYRRADFDGCRIVYGNPRVEIGYLVPARVHPLHRCQ